MTMKQTSTLSRYLICVKNEDYPASLELRKVYRRIPDLKAERHQLFRVIDESGEDYLYPREFFVPVKLPRAACRAFAPAS